MNDPIVEEVRGYRDDHAKQFNYDMNKICADFMATQGKSGHSVVRLKSKQMHQSSLRAKARNSL